MTEGNNQYPAKRGIQPSGKPNGKRQCGSLFTDGADRASAYTLYDLILPNMEHDVKLRFANVEYFDALLAVVA